jgi:putative ABC transport system permease protein
MPGSTSSGGARGGFGSQPTLTWDDLKAIQTEVPSVRSAAPVLRSNAQLLSEDQNWSTTVQGTTPEYFEIRNWTATNGTNLTQSDIDGGTKVIVLGQTVKQLFGAGADPVGQVVRIKNTPLQVVGVLQPKGQSPTGQDYDDGAFVPVTTFQAKIQGGLQKYLSGTIFVSAVSAQDTTRAQNAVTNLLRDRHHIRSETDDDF